MTVRIEASPDERAKIARILLDAAESDPSVVRTCTDGVFAFIVPDEIAATAGFEIDPVSGESADLEEPPRGGAGSGIAKWREFLTEKKIPFSADIKERDELVAIWDEQNETIG